MFVIWGAMHGMALVVHRFWRRMGYSMPTPLAWVTTFLFVNGAWVFFRAKTMEDALRVLRGMANVPSAFSTQIADIPTSQLAWGGWQMDFWLLALPAGLAAQLVTYLSIVLAFAVITRRNAFELTVREITLGKSIAGAFLFSVALYASIASTTSVFLYFNF
jgi:alginate O-acetyltransferase complex protein AlgI